MRRLGFSILFLLILVSPGFAQVDTLWFSLVNHLSVAGWHSIRTVDIDGDGIKELMACGENNIYIYNSLNNDLMWTSPSLRWWSSGPWTISFFDLNHDGDLDISVQDTILRIFDIVHDQVLWTCPVFPQSRNICSIIADFNSDGSNDIIIARREWNLGTIALDTMWVYVYTGPVYNLGTSFYFLVAGREADGYTLKENPGSMAVADLAGLSGPERKLLIFLETSTWEFFWIDEPGGVFVQNNSLTGRIAIIDPVTLDINMINNTSAVEFYSINQSDSTAAYLCAITNDYESSYSNGDWPPGYYHCNKHLVKLSADQLIDSVLIWHSDTLNINYLIGDIDPNHSGDELFYSQPDTIRLFSFPELEPIWSRGINTTFLNELYIYHSQSLLNSPQIFSRSPLTFINGASGLQSAVTIQTGLPLFYAADFDNDGDDELFGPISDTDLNVYRAILYSENIYDNPNTLPSSFRLHPNYPNPFNGKTLITYELPKESVVTIEIFDILGRKIETLVEARQPAGFHQVIWDGSAVSSGIYFYRLMAGEYTDIKRMTLLK